MRYFNLILLCIFTIDAFSAPPLKKVQLTEESSYDVPSSINDFIESQEYLYVRGVAFVGRIASLDSKNMESPNLDIKVGDGKNDSLICIMNKNTCYTLPTDYDTSIRIAHWIANGHWRAFSCLSKTLNDYSSFRQKLIDDDMVELGESVDNDCGIEFVSSSLNSPKIVKALKSIDYQPISINECDKYKDINGNEISPNNFKPNDGSYFNVDFGVQYNVSLSNDQTKNVNQKQSIEEDRQNTNRSTHIVNKKVSELKIYGYPNRYYWATSDKPNQINFVWKKCNIKHLGYLSLADSKKSLDLFKTAAVLRSLFEKNREGFVNFVNFVNNNINDK